MSAVAASIVVSYLTINLIHREPIKVWGLSIRLPGPRLAVAQVLVGAIDFAVAASVLWVLLPNGLDVTYLDLLAGYMLAVLATAFSHVPGGLGVFELVVLSIVLPNGSPAAVAAVQYRIVYFLFPLCAATAVYVAQEYRSHRQSLANFRKGVMRWSGPAVPLLLASSLSLVASCCFFRARRHHAGTTDTHRGTAPLRRAGNVTPGWKLGGNSAAGAVTRPARRYDSAWAITSVLIAIGIAASLLKGLDWEEATLLGFVLFLLLASRHHFYRRGSLLHSPLSWSWLAAMFIAVSAAIWLGLFAHKHIEYSNDLWWQIAYRADGRAISAGQSGIDGHVVVGGNNQSLSRPCPKYLVPTTEDLAAAANIIAHQSSTEGLLALVGTNRFCSTTIARHSCVRPTWTSWIALGNPVGPEIESTPLVWSFHELVDAHGGRTVFYHIPATSLPTYLQLGLTPVKVGDFGRVPLDEFTYEGHKFKELRQVRHRYDRAGFVFEIVARDDVPAVFPRLREISNQWLAEKNTAEKRFSVGCFSESYLSQTPIAVVKRSGEIFAFANVLVTRTKDELSIDLMRHVGEVPNGIMDYLFGQLMQWGQEQGFKWFSLSGWRRCRVWNHTRWPRFGIELETHFIATASIFTILTGCVSISRSFIHTGSPTTCCIPVGWPCPECSLILQP